MRAEVTFLRRMIFWIDEDRVVRTGSHASFTADADRFIEIDDAVSAFEHCGRRAGDDAWCMRALIATCDLMRATNLREDTDIDVLDVGARHPDGHHVFRLAGSRTRMAADTASVIDDLGPLHGLLGSCLLFNHG